MESEQDRKIQPIWVSFFIHALLVALLYYLLFWGDDRQVQGGDTIQIDSVTNDRQTGRRATTKKHISSQSKNSTHGVSLSDLGMRLDTRTSASDSSPTDTRNESEVASDDDWDVLNPDPRVARFNQYVYNVVQGWLDRDAYMNTKPLTGTVKIRVWFDENGNYLEKETIYEAIDPDFQAIVARALRKAFSVPIPRPYLISKKKFFIIRTVVIRH
jgi:hypothetical protein